MIGGECLLQGHMLHKSPQKFNVKITFICCLPKFFWEFVPNMVRGFLGKLDQNWPKKFTEMIYSFFKDTKSKMQKWSISASQNDLKKWRLESTKFAILSIFTRPSL